MSGTLYVESIETEYVLTKNQAYDILNMFEDDGAVILSDVDEKNGKYSVLFEVNSEKRVYQEIKDYLDANVIPYKLEDEGKYDIGY